MNWTEISIHTSEDLVDPVANILHDHGASGVAIEDPSDLVKEWDTSFGEMYDLNPADYPSEGVMVKAYLPVDVLPEQLLQQIKQSIDALETHGIHVGDYTIHTNQVNEEDWANAWKAFYKPVNISDRITIVPTWEKYEPKTNDEMIIELDPGMAFGTGTHPTTVMCIQALETYLKAGDSVIDVGTGSGVLSIAAAKLGASNVRAYDLDEVAVKSAVANIKENDVDNLVHVEQKNLLADVTEQADVMVANLLAEIILQFPDDAYKLVNHGGYFITSGIIKPKEAAVKSALLQSGFQFIETLQIEDWVAIIVQK